MISEISPVNQPGPKCPHLSGLKASRNVDRGLSGSSTFCAHTRTYMRLHVQADVDLREHRLRRTMFTCLLVLEELHTTNLCPPAGSQC